MSSRLERRWSKVFSRSQGRQKVLDARSRDASSQPRDGGERGSTQGPAWLHLLVPVQGRECWVKCWESLQRGGLKEGCMMVLSPQGSWVFTEGRGMAALVLS